MQTLIYTDRKADTHREKNKQAGTKTERQTGCYTDINTDRQTCFQTKAIRQTIQADRCTVRKSDGHAYRQAGTQTER